MMFWVWVTTILAMIVSRFFVKGVIDNSLSAHYKDWAHLLWGGGFVYACFKSQEIEAADFTKLSSVVQGAGILWFLLILALVVEVVMAIVNNRKKDR